jgi:hypothetical protein
LPPARRGLRRSDSDQPRRARAAERRFKIPAVSWRSRLLPPGVVQISGSLIVDGQILRAGDFHHAESESDHAELWTDEGVEVLLVAAASDYLE